MWFLQTRYFRNREDEPKQATQTNRSSTTPNKATLGSSSRQNSGTNLHRGSQSSQKINTLSKSPRRNRQANSPARVVSTTTTTTRLPSTSPSVSPSGRRKRRAHVESTPTLNASGSKMNATQSLIQKWGAPSLSRNASASHQNKRTISGDTTKAPSSKESLQSLPSKNNEVVVQQGGHQQPQQNEQQMQTPSKNFVQLGPQQTMYAAGNTPSGLFNVDRSSRVLLSDSPSKLYTGHTNGSAPTPEHHQHGGAASAAAAMVEHEEHEIPDLGTARFDIRNFLGSGGEGVVYEAFDRVNNELCALKVGNRTAQKNKGFEKEYAIYSHCVKHRVSAIPRLFDTRIAALHGSHSEQDPKPDYLALELFGPSIRMMLQAVCNKRAQQIEQGLNVPNRGSTMELRSIYVIAEKMIEVLEQLHKVKVLHHDVKPQNVVFRDRNRTLETDVVTNSDQLALIDLGMSYFVAENTKPKRHCRFCGSMDYSSRASRYRCQPSRRDDLESLSYLLLWLVMGNRSFKAWRSAVLEPYWEMLSVLFEDKVDIAEILANPSRNATPYAAALQRTNDETKVFIRRSAVQNSKKPDKKCDLGLFQTTMTTRPDDLIEGNLPKLNREKVPEKLLYFVLYCQTLEFAEIPNYTGLKAMFHRSSHSEGQELTIAQSNAEEIPLFVMNRMHTHCMVKDHFSAAAHASQPTANSSNSWHSMRQPSGDVSRDESCGMAPPAMVSRENPFSLAKPSYHGTTAASQQQASNIGTNTGNNTAGVPMEGVVATHAQQNNVMINQFFQQQGNDQQMGNTAAAASSSNNNLFSMNMQGGNNFMASNGSGHQHHQQYQQPTHLNMLNYNQQTASSSSFAGNNNMQFQQGNNISQQQATLTSQQQEVNLQESLRRRAEFASVRNGPTGRNPYVKFVSPHDDETYTLNDEQPRRMGANPNGANGSEQFQVKQQNFILGTSPMAKKPFLSTRGA
ncbi:unnamed protein product [Amoebophrya sp. A120]|nr:unnamed protein product [Amoebophrya sp. A120]|eukprot:GSA120T00002790001.1